MPHSHGPTPYSHALAHALAHTLVYALAHDLPHTMSPHYGHKLLPHALALTLHECGWKLLMIMAFEYPWDA